MAKKIIVYLHGICLHEAGYSDPWWAALSPHLGEGYDRAEVVWSDCVRSKTTLLPVKVEAEKRGIIDVLQDRAIRQKNQEFQRIKARYRAAFAIKPLASGGKPKNESIILPGMGCFDDVGIYLSEPDARAATIQRFIDVVTPLLMDGAEVHVISHSWGTVVAYEAMRKMDGFSSLTAKVANWFTCGAALSISFVKRQLCDTSGGKPDLVANWINLEARYDVVGGSLAGMYQVDSEYLGLDPTGCHTLAPDPRCSHGSYFVEANIDVNRDVFAKHILGNV